MNEFLSSDEILNRAQEFVVFDFFLFHVLKRTCHLSVQKI